MPEDTAYTARASDTGVSHRDVAVDNDATGHRHGIPTRGIGRARRTWDRTRVLAEPVAPLCLSIGGALRERATRGCGRLLTEIADPAE